MSISFEEAVDLQCPHCATAFTAPLWVIVDAGERPDLVGRILDGTVHDTTCPHCGESGQIVAPLLYHDARAKQVLLAVPRGLPDEELDEIGKTLLWTLIGAIPDSARGPYLAEVQAEAGLAGIAAVIQSGAVAAPPEQADTDDIPPLVRAIQDLLSAHGATELEAALRRHPLLLEPQTITILQELAHEAHKQGEAEAEQGFQGAATILENLRTSSSLDHRRAEAKESSGSADLRTETDPLDDLAFALLRSNTADALGKLIDEHPHLLDDASDVGLAEWAERARRDGKPRIARGIDERRETLRMMREQYQAEQPVFDAVQAFLDAASPAEVEAVLVEYATLWTDRADGLLERLAQNDDPEVAAFVAGRRSLLQQLRRTLEQERSDGKHEAADGDLSAL